MSIAVHSSAWKTDDHVLTHFESCYTFCVRVSGTERLLKRHGEGEGDS
jgi:hypothetical protein